MDQLITNIPVFGRYRNGPTVPIAVDSLNPFVAVDHPWSAVLDPQGPVQTHLVHRSERNVAKRFERAFRRLRVEHLCSAEKVRRFSLSRTLPDEIGVQGSEYVVFSPVLMVFRSPDPSFDPVVFMDVQDSLRTFPVLQVGTLEDFYATSDIFRSHGRVGRLTAIKIVDALFLVDKDIRVTDVEVFGLDCLRLKQAAPEGEQKENVLRLDIHILQKMISVQIFKP